MAVLSFPAFFGVGGPFLDIFGILGPKMGSKVPYLISGIARNGNYYLPCDFEPNPWRVDFRENCKGVPLQNFTKIDPSQIWLKIAGKVVYAISSNSSNKIGHFWAHFGPFFGVGKFFSHFLATRWGRGGLETSKMDSARVKTYNSTFLLFWTPSGGRVAILGRRRRRRRRRRRGGGKTSNSHFSPIFGPNELIFCMRLCCHILCREN